MSSYNVDSDGTQAASEDENTGAIESLLQEIGGTIWNSRTVGERSKLERGKTQEEKIKHPKPIGIRGTTSGETPQERVTIDSRLFLSLCRGNITNIWSQQKRTNLDAETKHIPDEFKAIVHQHGAKPGLIITNQARSERRQLEEDRCNSATNEGDLVAGQAGVVLEQEEGPLSPGFDSDMNMQLPLDREADTMADITDSSPRDSSPMYIAIRCLKIIVLMNVLLVDLAGSILRGAMERSLKRLLPS